MRRQRAGLSTVLPLGGVQQPAAFVTQKQPWCCRLGRRPHHETLKAYIRKLSMLVLEVVESGGQVSAKAAKAQGEVRAAAPAPPAAP